MIDRCSVCGSALFCLCPETTTQVILTLFILCMFVAVAIALLITAHPSVFTQSGPLFAPVDGG
jgi:hypothetical protein